MELPMNRTLLIALMTLALSAPAFAADDGGFGVGRMAAGSSKAFNDPSADPQFDPSSVEPASGTEDDVPAAPEDISPDKNANADETVSPATTDDPVQSGE